jgi:nucleoside-diphosphate-sugar epimerase
MAVQDGDDRPVLVTGACGLVGSHVVPQLVRDGHRVVATDLDTAANRRIMRRLARTGAVQVQWADLTDEGAVSVLLAAAQPKAIVHLAGIIPPFAWKNPELARRVNVGATAILVRAAEHLAERPRFVQASSIAIYGPRNPHRVDGPVFASTPPTRSTTTAPTRWPASASSVARRSNGSSCASAGS